ncbi:CDP-glycerol glycerophosphotransferase family protein [Phocicoccus pinnipedialis]|uniref:Teichoic acid ribitol-phosphate polymerase TarL n=2 Tax=Phocicoccus pinnipedialis TaxID=110845 RepID=A0A6V7R7B0_9BACL|nr:CDP-glycerol glycerophosphotransferase family protein [Jeotgalicoccus pinnipedialis]MBP1938965.1 CDP-ribitol ribitolphosphotransferase [Jeotgalicoccus pinnipedialis]CAD2073196.1 Teichoic acid ribitol-phosphate polymerase TarL [Jeotgalicoccus pinnipedialis]
MKTDVIITNFYLERVQLYIEGYVNNIDLKSSSFYIQNPTEKISLQPNQVYIENSKFKIRINTVNINEGDFLPASRYLLIVQDTKKNIAQLDSKYLNPQFYDLEENEIESYNKLESENQKNNFLLKKLEVKFRHGGVSKNYIYTITPQIARDLNEFIINISFKKPKPKLNYVQSKKQNIRKRYNKNSFFIRDFIFKSLFTISKILNKKRRNTVLFTSDSRAQLSGNLKFVFDKMIEKNLDRKYNIHFIFKRHVSERRSFINKIKFPILLGKANYIFLDDYHPMLINLKFRKDQEIIQVWHAVGAFKTVGYSRIGKKGGHFYHYKNHRYYTKTFVASEHDVPIYGEAFGIKDKNVIPTGVPRTDAFFDENYREKGKNRVYSKYPNIKNKKVILFAPTFRGNGHRTAFYPFFKIDLDRLAKYALENNAVILFKMHPLIQNKIQIPQKYEKYLIDVHDYSDINDLLFITDLLISDYSSVVYEYALLQKPMIFYAFDLEDYVATRDFYVNYTDFVPGKIVNNFTELMDAIENEDYETYKIDTFLNKYFKFLDGKASERLVDNVFNLPN